jgi:hypothetical protein
MQGTAGRQTGRLVGRAVQAGQNRHLITQAGGAKPAGRRDQAGREGRSGRQTGQIRNGGRQAVQMGLDGRQVR